MIDGCYTRRGFLKAVGLAAVSVPFASCISDAKKPSVQKRPNILFAISDDQSWPHASIYGCKGISTPAFDSVAKNGVLFSNAFTASPGCSPSRAAILTGRNCWQLEHAGTHASEFPAKYITYPDILEQSGYFVGCTGKAWGPGNYKVSGRTRNPAGNSFTKRKMKSPPGISSCDYAANFQDFLTEKPEDKPFCFWYGASEPHRSFSKGIGLKQGKKLEDADVPSFLPDTPEVRSDILDYYVEIEWFDAHLGKMIKALKDAGQFDNTLVVVTSDNGMAFPRAKANTYEYGVHMPLAISWPGNVPAKRTVDDLVSFIDFAPTFLEVAKAKPPVKYPMAGNSLMNILESDGQGVVDISRTEVFSARERHSSSRYNNLAYPQRCMRTQQYLYIRNFKPERWPAGTPQKYDKNNKLGPMHGGYHDIDACPTMDFLIANRNDKKISKYFHLSVDKRPLEELYDIKKDPDCLNNLADKPEFTQTRKKLATKFERYLKKTADPRILGTGDIFETYKRYSPIRKFPPPK